MAETTGTPIPPPAGAPKKLSPWVIGMLVIVLACCGCFGVVGLLVGFWDPIRQAFGFSFLLPALGVLM
jgi:hypothetical protein